LLEHGGRLQAAATRYDIALAQWLDLSTGINPQGWPVPALPARVWNRLPEPDDGLDDAAQVYYNAAHVLTVAGSQAAILALPWLRAHSRVGILTPGYAEHAQAWRRAGHSVQALAFDAMPQAIDTLDVLVLAHPNNPTGLHVERGQLLAWLAQLSARGGWLVVDEAFMDTTPEFSLAAVADPALIVLRSLGKFFGLAGARVGFVLAQPALLQRLNEHLGPWAVCGASRTLATHALRDRPWQTATRARLTQTTQRLAALLSQHGLAPGGGTALFQWVVTARAAPIHVHLARQGILTRLFDEPSSLRFGLPGNDADWMRLATALHGL
jgi:cobalamin biosynthesis protein CobC